VSVAAPELPLELLRASGTFEGFDDEQLAQVAPLLRPVSFAAGEAVVREGEPADSWYVIADGTAAVTLSDLTDQSVVLAVLGPGESFGERALVADDQTRSATVSAVTALEGYALDRADIQHNDSLTAGPALIEQLARRLDVMAIDAALKRASPFASLPRDALWSLAGQLQAQTVRAGDTIVRQGDAGDCFYLVHFGSVEVLRGKHRIALLRGGDSFGEVALLTPAPRTATVRALEDSELLVLTRDAFQAVAREYASVADYFRELVQLRFRGAPGQHLLLPDPLTTIMPLVGARRRKRYWVVLLIGVLLFALLSAVAHIGGSKSAVYAVMVLGSLIGPVVFVQYLAESNILTQRPLELIITAVLGAALGLPAALWLQREVGILPTSLLSALSIAAIEEPAKVLGVMWLLRLPALRFRMDGVIFGAAAGMGFAAFETGLYALARVELVGALLGVLWFRALLSPFTHGTWTAIVCAIIWRERSAGWIHGGWKIAAAFAVVILLHGLWDWPGFGVPWNFAWLLLIGAASVLTLRAILHRASYEEARSVAALAPEVAQAGPTLVGLRCDGCGRRAPGGARYCPRCGLALRRQSSREPAIPNKRSSARNRLKMSR
jgi:CRP-like cAMP-binding protein/RsiW-degrading membrane proteinase PrsW (M82 family)